jgi:hypothetical protein
MQRLHLLIVNDIPQNNGPLKAEIERRFGKDWQVTLEEMRLVVEHARKQQDCAMEIARQQPDVVLCDLNLFGSLEDGPRLMHALSCHHGFPGFIYIWSGADEKTVRSICDSHAPLFSHAGSGGFNNANLRGLAQKIYEDYEDCGRSFRTDPKARCFHAWEAARLVLETLMPLCLDPSTPQRETSMDQFQKALERLTDNALFFPANGEGQAGRKRLWDLARCINDASAEETHPAIAAFRDVLLKQVHVYGEEEDGA